MILGHRKLSLQTDLVQFEEDLERCLSRLNPHVFYSKLKKRGFWTFSKRQKGACNSSTAFSRN